jgi:hypothetical protein
MANGVENFVGYSIHVVVGNMLNKGYEVLSRRVVYSDGRDRPLPNFI